MMELAMHGSDIFDFEMGSGVWIYSPPASKGQRRSDFVISLQGRFWLSLCVARAGLIPLSLEDGVGSRRKAFPGYQLTIILAGRENSS